jgi:hypothetical protein
LVFHLFDAGFVLYGDEDQWGLADVFQIMEQVFTGAETEMTRITRGVVHFPGSSVVFVLPAASCADRGPEIIKDVSVGMEAVTGVQSDFPHSYVFRFGDYALSDVEVVGVLVEVTEDFFWPSVEVPCNDGPRPLTSAGDCSLAFLGCHDGSLLLAGEGSHERGDASVNGVFGPGDKACGR